MRPEQWVEQCINNNKFNMSIGEQALERLMNRLHL
jgi:CRP-like cAMP-binding protein